PPQEAGGRSLVMPTFPSQPSRFPHERLDAYYVAREALTQGEAISRDLPRGYATLADQLRRALLSAHLGVAEAAARSGADRLARGRCGTRCGGGPGVGARGEGGAGGSAAGAAHGNAHPALSAGAVRPGGVPSG